MEVIMMKLDEETPGETPPVDEPEKEEQPVGEPTEETPPEDE